MLYPLGECVVRFNVFRQNDRIDIIHSVMYKPVRFCYVYDVKLNIIRRC